MATELASTTAGGKAENLDAIEVGASVGWKVDVSAVWKGKMSVVARAAPMGATEAVLRVWSLVVR